MTRKTDFELAGEAIETIVARRRPGHAGHWRHISPMRDPPDGWGETEESWLGMAREMLAAFNRRVAPPVIHLGDSALLGLGAKPLVLFQLRLATAREAFRPSSRMRNRLAS